MFSFIRKLFPRRKVKVNTQAPTIPQAFGYNEQQFEILVNELVNFIKPEDRLGSFDTYLSGPLFAKFYLDPSNPNHAALIGYAFCAAVLMQRGMQTQIAVNKVLREFYPATTPPQQGSDTIN